MLPVRNFLQSQFFVIVIIQIILDAVHSLRKNLIRPAFRQIDKAPVFHRKMLEFRSKQCDEIFREFRHALRLVCAV